MDDVRVRELVAKRLPEYRVEDVELIGAGMDNTAYVVNGRDRGPVRQGCRGG